jgi:hypothetical protein
MNIQPLDKKADPEQRGLARIAYGFTGFSFFNKIARSGPS